MSTWGSFYHYQWQNGYWSSKTKLLDIDHGSGHSNVLGCQSILFPCIHMVMRPADLKSTVKQSSHKLVFCWGCQHGKLDFLIPEPQAFHLLWLISVRADPQYSPNHFSLDQGVSVCVCLWWGGYWGRSIHFLFQWLSGKEQGIKWGISSFSLNLGSLRWIFTLVGNIKKKMPSLGNDALCYPHMGNMLCSFLSFIESSLHFLFGSKLEGMYHRINLERKMPSFIHCLGE